MTLIGDTNKRPVSVKFLVRTESFTYSYSSTTLEQDHMLCQ